MELAGGFGIFKVAGLERLFRDAPWPDSPG
jgi:hypothetical protein